MIYSRAQRYEACKYIGQMAMDDPQMLLIALGNSICDFPTQKETEKAIKSIVECVYYQQWGLIETAEIQGKTIRML